MSSLSYRSSVLAGATSAFDKLRAYLTGTADYVAEHRSLHVAVIEIALNATSADGRPLVATMPLQALQRPGRLHQT
jgi:hypothetical protein